MTLNFLTLCLNFSARLIGIPHHTQSTAKKESNPKPCAYTRQSHYLLSYTLAWQYDCNASKKGELAAVFIEAQLQARVQVQRTSRYLPFNCFGVGFQFVYFHPHSFYLHRYWNWAYRKAKAQERTPVALGGRAGPHSSQSRVPCLQDIRIFLGPLGILTSSM